MISRSVIFPIALVMVHARTKVNYQKMYLIAYGQIQVQMLKNKNTILCLKYINKEKTNQNKRV